MKKEDISALKQMIESLEESDVFFEESYKKKQPEKFEQTKKLILQILKRTEEILK